MMMINVFISYWYEYISLYRLSELYGKDDKEDRDDEQGIPGNNSNFVRIMTGPGFIRSQQ